MFVIQPFVEYARIPEATSISKQAGGERGGKSKRCGMRIGMRKREREEKRDAGYIPPADAPPVVSSGQTNCLVLKAARTKRHGELARVPATVAGFSVASMVAADI